MEPINLEMLELTTSHIIQLSNIRPAGKKDETE